MRFNMAELKFSPPKSGSIGRSAALFALLIASALSSSSDAQADDATGMRHPDIVTVHPSTDEVPANLLRIYVEFSRPMERGHVREAVTVIDHAGELIDGALLAIGREFWSSDMRRLTLIFDPGRIKTGLLPNLTNGVPLGTARSITLAIGTSMRDGDGSPIAMPFQRTYLIGPDDRAGPDPAAWTLYWDPSNRPAILRVEFDGSIDAMIARRTLRLETADGAPVPTQLELAPDAGSAMFTPVSSWPIGELRLAIHPTLEDPAGNRIGTSFDMDSGTVAQLQPHVHYLRVLPAQLLP